MGKPMLHEMVDKIHAALMVCQETQIFEWKIVRGRGSGAADLQGGYAEVFCHQRFKCMLFLPTLWKHLKLRGFGQQWADTFDCTGIIL
jgi:hypothetical protein